MGMNLYNCRTYNNKQLNGYSVDNYHVVFLFSGDIDKIPFKYSPTSLLPCGSPEASEIFAHSLKAKFPISFLDSVFWIPLELIWVLGCLAISVYYLCVLLFPQFPQTHKHICTYKQERVVCFKYEFWISILVETRRLVLKSGNTF